MKGVSLQEKVAKTEPASTQNSPEKAEDDWKLITNSPLCTNASRFQWWKKPVNEFPRHSKVIAAAPVD